MTNLLLLLLLLSRFSRVRLCATPSAANQAPPSLGFSRQEHWSGLSLPSPMHEIEKWKWSHFSRVQPLVTPWTAAYQAPLSMGFSRQEYWSGVPLPSPTTNLDSILKSRHYFANKGPSSQGYGFSSGHVWMWEVDCEESWVPKNWCFEVCCWRRLLRVPWTARRSNWSILKEISPGISLEGMTLKLKLQYFGHLMRRVDSLEKTLMLGGIGGRRKRGWQRMRWLDGITDLSDMSLS